MWILLKRYKRQRWTASWMHLHLTPLRSDSRLIHQDTWMIKCKLGISCLYSQTPLSAGQCLHPFNAVVQSKIYWQLLTRLTWNLLLIFMLPGGWFLMISFTFWPFVQLCHKVRISPSPASSRSKNVLPDVAKFSVDILVLQKKDPGVLCSNQICKCTHLPSSF